MYNFEIMMIKDNKMKKNLLIQESGRSMMEALGYISVMIMLTVSVTAAVNSGYYRFKLGRINQELVDLKKVISQRYVAAENYKGVSFDILINEKIVPHDVKDKRHAFGGDINIGSGDSNGNTYYIEFRDMPVQSCVELGSRLWIVNDGSDLDAMDIKGKKWGWEYSNSINNPDYMLPARPVDVAKACNPVCTDEDGNIILCPPSNNYIRWYFN